MNILLVSTSVEGGAGKACLRLFRALQQNGQSVKLLHLEGSASVDPDIISFYPSIRNLFVRQLTSFPLKNVKHYFAGDFHCQYRLPYSIHRMEKHPLLDWADIINLHWVPEFLDYRRFFSRIGDKPVVWTMHDMLPFTGGYHYQSEIPEIRRLRTELRIAGYKQAAVRDTNLAAVAPSRWLLEMSKKYGTFSNCLHHHIFNAVPTDIYRPIEKHLARSILNLPQDRKIVLFAAASLDSPRKGGALLTAALATLFKQDVVLVSVGSARMKLDPGTAYRHLGYFGDDVSMALCYSSADVVAVPSIEDNSPNIIIESFSCGRPVVAFDVGGIGELIDRSELGILSEGVSASAFESAIRKALSSDFDVKLISAYAEKRFSYDILAEEYLRVFEVSLNQ